MQSRLHKCEICMDIGCDKCGQPFDPAERGMDAIDALLCLGFKIVKIQCGSSFVLAPSTFAPLYQPYSVEGEAIRSAMVEIENKPDHHYGLIQQKGISL